MNNSPWPAHWMLSAVVIVTCGLSAPAIASPQVSTLHDLAPTPQTMADAMAVEDHSPDRLNRLAGQMGQRVGRPSGPEGSSVTEQMPFINDLIGNFLDDSGEFKLPLGLTVYDAMGTTSVGFGSTF